MGFDTLKQYKVKISGDATEFLKELNRLESEAGKKLKDLNLSDGLRSDIEKLVQEVGLMKKTLNSATDDVKNNFNTISNSVGDLNTKMDSLQEAMKLLGSGDIDKTSKSISDSFNRLSDNITEIIGKFRDVSDVIEKLQTGKIDMSTFDGVAKSIKDAEKEVNKDTKRLKKALKDLADYTPSKVKLLDAGSVSKQSREFLSVISGFVEAVESELKSLDKSVNVAPIFADSLGIGAKDLKVIKNNIKQAIDGIDAETKENMPKTIDTDVRFRIKLGEDVEGTATVDSLTRKVNDIVESAQKKVKSIKIPIGYTTDVSDVKNQKELDDIQGKDTDKTIFKRLNLEVKANTDNLVNQVNAEVASVNKKLKESGRRIEVEVIGKVNPDTIEDSAKNIAYEVEDAQHQLKNNININGGNVSIDTSSGIATESTLTEIKSILSQWNATGIPGTQSEEFKQQLKNKESNAAIASDFDKYFRRFSYKPTKKQSDIQNTTDFLMSTLSMRLDKKEALKVLKRNRDLKKGGEEGLAALHASDYYKKSKIIDGVEYSAFETGTPLKDWQAKLDKMFLESFDDAGKIIGGLFDVTTEVNGKKKKIKGYLQSQIDKVDRDNKSTRESLGLNGVNYKKDKYGKYTDEIVHESGTVTSTEDAYAKTKSVVDRIKADAEAEYRIQEAKTQELIEQRNIMQQIFDLEQRQKSSPLSQEDNELLTSLKQDLSYRIKEVSNQDQYDKLIDEQNKLQEKKMKEGLTTPEFNRLKEIDTEIEGLFKEVDDLSSYVVKQMATDAETGLSFIDQRIKEANESAKEIIKTAQQNIGQVFNPTDESGNRNTTTVQVKSQAQYDYYEKEIKRAQERNSYLSRLVKQKTDKNGKNTFDYSAMTDAEKAEYFSNQKYIQSLRARNLLYAEQNNLEKELIENKDKIVTKEDKVVNKEKVAIKSLHVPDSEKEDYEKVYANMMNAGVDDKDYLSNLSDEDFDKAMTAFERVNRAIDNQAQLSNEEIQALVQNRIDEDIAYLKKSLEQEEAELIKMEKNPSNYSQKQIDNKKYRVGRISSSIEQLENPNSNSRSSTRSLEVHRDILRDVQSERNNIIQQIKTELGLTDEQIELVQELFAINKKMSDAKDEIRQKDKELNTSTVSDISNKKGEITSQHVDALKNSRTILFGELEELESREKEIISKLSSSDNVDALKQLGVLNFSSEEKDVLLKKTTDYTNQVIDNLSKQLGLNEENIKDLKQILTLETKINKEQVENDKLQKIIDSPLYDLKRGNENKSNVLKEYKEQRGIPLSDDPLVLNISQQDRAEIEKKWKSTIIDKEKSDAKLDSLNKSKQEAIKRIIPTITAQVKEEIQHTISVIQSKIEQGDSVSVNKQKEKEWQDILDSPNAIQEIVQQRINSMFEGMHNIIESVKAQMPQDGTQMNFGVLSQDNLTQLFTLLEQEEILSDAIYQIIARVNGSGAMHGKHFRANSGMGEAKFDPFDTTYDPKNLYEERSALYTDQITHIDDASVSTARQHLELAKEVALEREKEKQRLVQIHEEEKKIVAERHKELALSDKKYKEQYLSSFGFADESNTTEGRIGEARSKVNEISQEIEGLQSDRTKLDTNISKISEASEHELINLIKREQQIADQRQDRLNKINELQDKINSRKETEVVLNKNDGETDEAYQARVLDLQKKRKQTILDMESKLKNLRKENTSEIKKENKELQSIAKTRGKMISKYGDTSGLSSDGLLNNANLAYANYEKIKNKYDATKSRLGENDDEVIALGKELKEARDKYISEVAKYFSSSSVDDIDKNLSQMIAKLRADEKKRNPDKQKDIYLDSEDEILKEQKKRLENIKKIQDKIDEKSRFSVDNMTRHDGEEKKDFEARKQEAQKRNQEELIQLQERLNKKQTEHNSLLEIEERRLLQLRFEKQSQLKLDEQTSDLRKQRDAKTNEIAEAQIRKNAAESELKLQKQAREEAEKRLATNKEIKKFQTGMNAKQKKASLGVDLELLRIQELQEKQKKAYVNFEEQKHIEKTIGSLQKKLKETSSETKEYRELGQQIQDLQNKLSQSRGTTISIEEFKNLEKQIVEAKRELELFRAEADGLGLTLSETTGRMFLNSDTGLTGLTYTGLGKDIKPVNTGYAPTKEDIARQKEMSKEQVKSYHYHSDIVDAVKAESNERKRLWKMSLIAGMTDDQAEVTLEIQKTVASVKDWNKATEEQKSKLKELHEKAKYLDLEIYDKGKSKNYVKQLVSTKDFKINPEQYATNKYLQQMLSSPTGSYYKNDLTQITNLRLATESTLQNIQNILMAGVKVKIMDSKKYPNYKGKLNKLPDVNGDKDPYGYIIEQQEKKKNKKPRVYDAAKFFGYDAMSPTQQGIAKRFADTKNKISQKYTKELGNELHSIIEEAKEAGLKYSKKKKTLYYNDSDNKAKKSEKNTNAKTNTKTAEKSDKDKSKDKKQSESKEARNRLRTILNNVESSTEEKQKAVDEVLARKWNVGNANDGSYFVGGSRSKASLDITKEYAKKHGLVIDESKIGSWYEKESDKTGESSTVKASNDLEIALQKNTEQQNEVKEQLSNMATRIADVMSGKSSEDPKYLNAENQKLIERQVQLKKEEAELQAKIDKSKTEKQTIDETKTKKAKPNAWDFDATQLTEKELKAKLRAANTQIAKGSAHATEWEKKRPEIIAALEAIEKKAEETTETVKAEAKEQAEAIISVPVENDVESKNNKDKDVKQSKSEEQQTTEETVAIKEKTEALKEEWKVAKTVGEVNRQLGRKNLSAESREKWTQIAKFNGYEIDSESGLAIEKVADAIDEATESQEKLNKETAEYKTIQEAAYKNGLSSALDVTKTTSVDKKGNKKTTYNATDIHGNSITVDEFGEIKQLKKVKEVISKDAQELKQLMSQVSSTLNNNSVQEIYDYMDSLLPAGEVEKVNELRIAYDSLNETLNSFVQGDKDDFSEEELKSIENQIKTINNIKSSFSGEIVNLGKLDSSQVKNLQSTLKGLAQEFEEVEINNIKFGKANREMTYQVLDSDKMLNTYRITVSKTGDVMKELVKSEKYLNPLQRVFAATGKKFGEIFNYMVASTSIYEVFNLLRQGVTVVKEFDTALTEMRKVSDESIQSLKNFQSASFDVASAVGTTAQQIQNSTADWMRLGETINEAAESARVSNILLNVSEFESIDQATESLVAMSAAYSDLDKITIVDKLNQVGNNFSISTDGLATALQKSASALTTAGNDMDQAVALITAGNAVVQDADMVGAGLRTIALRISGTEAAKEELASLGEDVDDFVVQTSAKSQQAIKDFTRVASNNFEGFDILDDNGNFKSTYEILLGISEIYEEIVQTDRQYGSNMANGLLETLAGKNRANIAASILQNPQLLKDVYASSQNSEGSAEKELEKYLDSIEGKIQQFNNEVQELWYNILDSDVLKGFIDMGTGIVDFLGKVIDNLGVINTLGISLGTIFSVKHIAKNSGGRDKKFSLVIKYATESFSREVCEFWCISEW